MSASSYDRNALNHSYYTKHLEALETLSDQKGVVKAYALRTFNQSWLNPDVKYHNDPSPYKYIRYRTSEHESLKLYTRAKDLLQRSITTRNMGFTFESLMQLDYTTFCDMETLVFEETMKNKKPMKQLEDDLGL